MSSARQQANTLAAQYGALLGTLRDIAEGYLYAGRLDDALRLLGTGLQIAESSDAPPRAAAQLWLLQGHILSTLTFQRNADPQAALAALHRARDLAEVAGDRALQGDALGQIGMTLHYRRLSTGEGTIAACLELFQEGLALREAAGDGRGICEAFFQIGLMHQFARNLDEARTHLARSYALASEHSWPVEGSYAIRHLAFLDGLAGDHAAALQQQQESLRLREECGARHLLAFAHIAVGDAYSEQGEPAAARAEYERALVLGEELAVPVARAFALYSLGEWYRGQGECVAARQSVGAARACAAAIGYQRLVTLCNTALDALESPASGLISLRRVVPKRYNGTVKSEKPPLVRKAVAMPRYRHRSRAAWRSKRAPTLIVVSPRVRWVLVLVGIVALVLLIRAAPSILSITLGGFTLAMILSFPVRALSRIMPRGLAILTTLLLLLGSVVVAMVALIPTLINQLTQLIAALPSFADDTDRLLHDLLRPLQERGLLPGDPDVLIAQAQQELINQAQTIAQRSLTLLLSWVSQTISFVFTAFGIVFVAIYLLSDTRKLKAAYLWAAPKGYRRDAAELWGDFGSSLSRYLSGLFVVIVIQGVVSTVALTLLDVPYAVVLGAWVSATAILPYIGAWLGAIPAVTIAAFISPTKALLVLLAYVGIQQLEGNVLTPRIQGQALRVHPILVFLAVIAGGEIAGLRGAIFAVPTLAVLRVLVDFLRHRLRVLPPFTALHRRAPDPTALPGQGGGPPPSERTTAGQ